MKKNYLVILIVACILTGCISTPTNDTYTQEAKEVRSGVYVTNDASALPLPIYGYDIYLVGEMHGQREIHLLFLDYLKTLHEANGLRDIVLEMEQFHEREINDYVLGFKDTLPFGYFTEIILPGVRALNDTLPEDEKIRVHAVDVDYSVSAIKTHLQALKEEIGPQAEDIQITWWSSEDKMLVLVDQLTDVVGNHDTIINELETVRSSIRWYFVDRVGASIREERIAANIQYVLRELDGAPVLALFGVWHARQTTKSPHEYGPWAQRLVESRVSIYSIYAMGISGRGVYEVYMMDPDEIYFVDGTTLGDIFDSAPDYDIVYVDLRLDTNTSVRSSKDEVGPFGDFDPDIPIAEMFDGIIVFRKVTPTQNDNS